ncbi:MAG: hypothetical protein O2973_04920 [Gemmatimonadetes bacterium]|nr:hypothetical protein [Gemmatimonadota bacterium]
MALALAPLMALWGLVTSIAALRTSRADLAATAWRGLAAATACAAIAVGALAWAMVTHDFTVGFVAENSSWHVPVRYAAASLLHAPGGALLAWAALAGTAGLASVGAAGSGPSRMWVTAIVTGALVVALSAVAYVADPFVPVTGAIGDGAGLSPDLQRGAAVAYAVCLLVGTAATLPAFALTAGALATATLDERWSRAVRVWNAVAWCALFVAAVAAARWFALNPLRGPWLGDPATALWLFPVAVGAWLVHLDAGRSTAERVLMRVLLVTVMFTAATGAVSVLSGAFVQGIAPHRPSPAGVWFAIVPAGAFLLQALLIRRGRRSLSGSRAVASDSVHAPGAWIAHAGFILLLGAVIGSAFAASHDVALADAGIFRAKDPLGHQWSFTSQGVSTLRRENFGSVTISLLPSRDGSRGPMLSAEARSYVTDDPSVAGQEAFTTAALGNAFLETRFSITDPDASPEKLRISFVPLATWILPGALLIVMGTLVPLVGRPRKAA